MSIEFECWDCGETAEFESMDEAVENGWTRIRTGRKTGRYGEPQDGEGYDLCPDDSSSTRSLELVSRYDIEDSSEGLTG